MDLTTEAIRLALHMSRLRAEVASENIAHVDVPGYRARRVDFGEALGLLHEAAMQPSMEGGQLQDMNAAALHDVVHVTDAPGDSPVRLDDEVAELESANVNFQSLTTVMSRRFALMQLAMTGRS